MRCCSGDGCNVVSDGSTSSAFSVASVPFFDASSSGGMDNKQQQQQSPNDVMSQPSQTMMQSGLGAAGGGSSMMMDMFPSPLPGAPLMFDGGLGMGGGAGQQQQQPARMDPLSQQQSQLLALLGGQRQGAGGGMGFGMHQPGGMLGANQMFFNRFGGLGSLNGMGGGMGMPNLHGLTGQRNQVCVT